jgi:hypothetical protein
MIELQQLLRVVFFDSNVQAKERVARTNDSVVVYLSLSEFRFGVCGTDTKVQTKMCVNKNIRAL